MTAIRASPAGETHGRNRVGPGKPGYLTGVLSAFSGDVWKDQSWGPRKPGPEPFSTTNTMNFTDLDVTFICTNGVQTVVKYICTAKEACRYLFKLNLFYRFGIPSLVNLD